MDRTSASYWTLLTLGSLAILNGTVMMLAPEPYFFRAAADTGPLNPHFVRDVGAAYATSGIAAVWAARNAAWRAPLAAGAALFQALHAAIHMFEDAAGTQPMSRVLGDTAAVYLPTLILAAVALHALRRAPEHS
jgi:hypothetical protein